MHLRYWKGLFERAGFHLVFAHYFWPIVLKRSNSMILAYIDPAGFSAFVQLIVAACAGGIFIFRQKIKTFFTRKKRDDNGKKN